MISAVCWSPGMDTLYFKSSIIFDADKLIMELITNEFWYLLSHVKALVMRQVSNSYWEN
jgi:hypothetical protein